MNIKFIPALLLFVFSLSACGSKDTSLPFTYPFEANFKGISNTTEIKTFSKTDGAVAEIPADSTTVDSHPVFSDLESKLGFTKIIFEDASNASSVIDSPPSSFAMIYTVSGETLFFTQPFGAIPDFHASGNPAAFQVECVAYAISSASGEVLSNAGIVFESEEALISLMKTGDTLAYLTYITEYWK